MMSWGNPIEILLSLAVGAALGAFYFALLMRTVRLHAVRAAAGRIVALYIVRIAAAVAGFWLVAQQGAPPLLAALVGFLVVRRVAQHWMASV